MFTKKGTSGQQGSGSSSGTGSGTGSGTTAGDGTGSGVGAGSGPSFSLVGRTAKNLPKPSYASDAQGKVVVDVNVDQEGNVIDAQFNSRLSTTTDLQLRNAAIEAARKSKFSVKLDAAVVQRGTITYTFIKLN
jgi:colicin import membrane protein